MTEIGIIVGRVPPDEILAAFARAGHDLAPADPARGTFVVAGRRGYGGVRIHDDEAHLTFKELCPFPHSIVEVSDNPSLAGTMRGLVAGYGGYLRAPLGATTPAPTPEGENPAFDLLRSLDAVEGLDHRARGCLARIARDDPSAFLGLARAVAAHAESIEAGRGAPAP
jgi:hypothetical protein